MDGKTDQHESYGMIGFFRIQGGSGALFGSSIKHHNFIRLRVHTATRRRDLHHNWYHADKELVELDLSPTQFADLLTSMNVGDGVPCTLRTFNGKTMDECPAIDQREIFEQEFEADVRKVNAKAAKLAQEADVILTQKKVLKGDLQRLRDILHMLMQDIHSNMPFVQQSFNEAIEKTVTEAKGEVEAFVQHKIVSLGLAALREEVASGNMLPDAKDRTAFIEAQP